MIIELSCGLVVTIEDNKAHFEGRQYIANDFFGLISPRSIRTNGILDEWIPVSYNVMGRIIPVKDIYKLLDHLKWVKIKKPNDTARD